MEFRLGTEQGGCGPGDVLVNPGDSEEHEVWLHKDTEVIDSAIVKCSYLKFEHSSLATAVSSLLTGLTGSSPNSCNCARSIRARRSTASRVWSRTSCVAGGHGGYLRRGRLCLCQGGFCQCADAIKDLPGVEAAFTRELLPVPSFEVIAPALAGDFL